MTNQVTPEPLQFRMSFDKPMPAAEQIRTAEGMKKARQHCDPEWAAAVKKAIYDACHAHQEFTVDEVWVIFERDNKNQAWTHIKDPIGPLMKEVAAELTHGKHPMHSTQAMRRSKREGSHGNALVVWHSNLYQEQQG